MLAQSESIVVRGTVQLLKIDDLCHSLALVKYNIRFVETHFCEAAFVFELVRESTNRSLNCGDDKGSLPNPNREYDRRQDLPSKRKYSGRIGPADMRDMISLLWLLEAVPIAQLRRNDALKDLELSKGCQDDIPTAIPKATPQSVPSTQANLKSQFLFLATTCSRAVRGKEALPAHQRLTHHLRCRRTTQPETSTYGHQTTLVHRYIESVQWLADVFPRAMRVPNRLGSLCR